MNPEENIINYPNSLETRVALLEMSILTINQTLNHLEAKMDKHFDHLMENNNRLEAKMEKNFDHLMENNNRLEVKMDKQHDEIKSEMKDIRNEMKDIRRDMKIDFRWILTIIAALGGIMAHGFHWF